MDTSWRKLGKDVSIALLNATALSALAFLFNLLVGSSQALTLTVATAMFAVVVFATLMGTFLPLMFNKVNIDPAVATGPFITTMNDILGMLVYLMLSAYFFGVFM
ncbi:MAG TPA: hypothetical protein DEG09_13755 [Marinilabiliaceae bacterium]|nr:hypothetical protein [Marinilabiliaceae bacterium]